MKRIVQYILVSVCLLGVARAQVSENIIIITTDGFRWQEVFGGLDTAIANNPKFNQGDSAYLYKKYGSESAMTRREKLLPFLWETIAGKGKIYGNRWKHSTVEVRNRYWFSYPGYNEIFTGFPDTLVNSNSYPPNPHVTVLEYLNKQPEFHNRVAAFGAWDAFGRILNKDRSGIPVVSGFDLTGGEHPTEREQLLNQMLKDSYRQWHEEECFDVFTHHAAMECLRVRKPKVLYIAYGETDEWAHAGQYRSYLDAAHQVDQWIREIWDFVEKDPQYRGKTTLFITVDHGRGDMKKEEWTSHGASIVGANEIWFAVMGPGIPALGEIRNGGNSAPGPVFQQQFAQTFASILGFTYSANHPIAADILDMLKSKK